MEARRTFKKLRFKTFFKILLKMRNFFAGYASIYMKSRKFKRKRMKHFLKNCIYIVEKEIMRKEIAENKKEKQGLVMQLIKTLFTGKWCDMNASFIKTNR